MNAETTKPAPKTAEKPRKHPKHRPQPTAQQRVEAVLSIWSERRRPSEVCKELNINATQLSQWQDRALGVMLEALQPRSRPVAARPESLSPKLARLLSRQVSHQASRMQRLEKRLTTLQESKPQP